MMKLFVGDIAAGEKFYGAVFGAKPTLAVGSGAHIESLPNGGPGFVMIQSGANDSQKKSSFIMQVPDLETARSLALANGATEQATFAGAPQQQAAKSIDLLDPWGNQVEILQLG